MNDMNLLERALHLVGYHADQVDKTGMPYIMHVLRVAAAGRTVDEVIVGLLHDLVEDTPISLDYLRTDFPEHIVDAVDAITRRPRGKDGGETYWDYLDRLVENPLAARVKLYDLEDNLNPSRQNFEGADSLHRRHKTAYDTILFCLRGNI